ncbi:MAG: LysM peptidoglycan-binding domain-containing protein [Deltaproteobacteria bacterium]|nr:LysM peptidoglycan-binding domain-containing protein [Deltaproteobacteria bacterium]
MPRGGGSYTVQAGESWFSIAGTELGDQRAFEALMAANPGIVSQGLQPGMVLNLPTLRTGPDGTTISPTVSFDAVSIAANITAGTMRGISDESLQQIADQFLAAGNITERQRAGLLSSLPQNSLGQNFNAAGELISGDGTLGGDGTAAAGDLVEGGFDPLDPTQRSQITDLDLPTIGGPGNRASRPSQQSEQRGGFREPQDVVAGPQAGPRNFPARGRGQAPPPPRFPERGRGATPAPRPVRDVGTVPARGRGAASAAEGIVSPTGALMPQDPGLLEGLDFGLNETIRQLFPDFAAAEGDVSTLSPTIPMLGRAVERSMMGGGESSPTVEAPSAGRSVGPAGATNMEDAMVRLEEALSMPRAAGGELSQDALTNMPGIMLPSHLDAYIAEAVGVGGMVDPAQAEAVKNTILRMGGYTLQPVIGLTGEPGIAGLAYVADPDMRNTRTLGLANDVATGSDAGQEAPQDGYIPRLWVDPNIHVRRPRTGYGGGRYNSRNSVGGRQSGYNYGTVGQSLVTHRLGFG